MSPLTLPVLSSLLIAAFITTILCTLIFRRYAEHFSIVATKNSRTLHKYSVPKGAGLIFSLVIILFTIYFWSLGWVNNQIAIAISAGGLMATSFGFVDDILDISAKIKLIIQISLSIFTVILFGHIDFLALWLPSNVIINLIDVGISIFFLVWLINLTNFMDGSDGLAASGSSLIFLTLAVVLFLAQNELALISLPILSAVCCIAFLVFNYPPASVFMGDAGSVFLGYIHGVFIFYTLGQEFMSIWNWLIIFGYFAIDTTVTLICRLLIVPKWYGAHRSHAYQNLARIWDDHKRVLLIIITYQLIWLFPLSLLAFFYPIFQLYFCVLAVTPVVIWTLKYGPLLSSS